MDNSLLAFFEPENSPRSYTEYSDATNAPQKLWRKEILLFGKWKHPNDPSVEFVVDKSVVEQVLKNFYSGIPVEAPVVLTHTDDPRMKVGQVKFFVQTERGIDAILSVVDEETNRKIDDKDTSPGVSVWLDLAYKNKETGKPVGAVIKHVALVNHPYIEGMQGFSPVFLSEDGHTKITYVPLKLGEKEPTGEIIMTKEEAIAFLKTEGIDVLSLQEENKAFADKIEAGEIVPKDNVFVMGEELKGSLVKIGLSEADFEDVGGTISKVVEKLNLASAEVVSLSEKIADADAESEVGVLLSEQFIFPSEKDFLKNLKKKDAVLFSEFVENRKKMGKVVDLSEHGKSTSDKDTAIDHNTEIERHVSKAKSEGFIKGE